PGLGGPVKCFLAGADLEHGVPGALQPGGQDVALRLVVIDEEQNRRRLGHEVSRHALRIAKVSRSLVSSSLCSSAAARGGGSISTPVITIAGIAAGSWRSSAAPSRPGMRRSVSTRST